MGKIGMNRIWGIIIALSIFFAAFILFNLLTYLTMNKDINELSQIAMSYNTNYRLYLETSANLRNYNEKIEQRAYELVELENLMIDIDLNYSKTETKINFSGIIDPEKFSKLLNFVSNANTLKINKMDTESQTELPLLIGQSETPDVYVKEMEIELIQIDDKILEG